MAISRSRAAVRARSRLATLTHATSRTMPTAPRRTSKELRVEPVTTSFTRRSVTRRPAADGLAIALSSCRAASSPAPGRSRATTDSNRPRTTAGISHGIHKSTPDPRYGNWNSAGMTPITVKVRPSRFKVRPTAAEAAPKCARENAWETTVTFGGSLGAMVRPAKGAAPRRENSPGSAGTTESCSGSPIPKRLPLETWYVMNPSNIRL